MAQILDGKKLSDLLAKELVKKVKKLKTKPKLVIIQVGDLAESNRYIGRKKAFGEKIGVEVEHKKYPKNVSDEELVRDISEFNTDDNIHGIIVQLPIPKHLNTAYVVNTIDRHKDVDCLNGENIKALFDHEESYLPATTKGIISLLKHYKISVAGKKVVVVGESQLVGRPVALALLNRKATVTTCNRETKNLARETTQADILIAAAGSPNLIKEKHVKKSQIVIDVGFSIRKGKIVGDVDFNKVKNKVKAITPVPGGVGPLTVVSLFENLLEAYKIQVS